jgi:transposase
MEDIDYITSEKMNTDSMSRFLVQVSEKHEHDFMVMVMDGASSFKCKELKVPGNITFVFRPPYSPELNPAGQIWNTLGETALPTEYLTHPM